MKIIFILAIMLSINAFAEPLKKQSRKNKTQLTSLVPLSQSQIPTLLEKPSLKEYGKELKFSTEINKLFKETQGFVDTTVDLPTADIEKVWKANSKLMEKWEGAANKSTPFVRGEIDAEEVLNSTLTAVQLSLLHARFFAVKGNFFQVKDEISTWLTFAADLPYEEASLISLRLANLIRSLLLDELESLQKKWPEKIAKDGLWLHWARGVRAPWPIDRVVLSESKRLLKSKAMLTAEQVARALQKNTYQTAEAALEKVKGPKLPEHGFLKQMWRTEDIEAMKTEVNRLNEFRIRLAVAVYERQNKKKPTQIEELVGAKLLYSVPINYMTGKPFILDQAASH